MRFHVANIVTFWNRTNALRKKFFLKCRLFKTRIQEKDDRTKQTSEKRFYFSTRGTSGLFKTVQFITLAKMRKVDDGNQPRHRAHFIATDIYKNSGRKQTKDDAPLGTSSFVVFCALPPNERKSERYHQGERISPWSAEGSSPQMGLTNCSIVPISSPELSGTSASTEPLRGLPKSRRSCISTLIVVTQGWIYCNFIMGSVYFAMNFFPLVT